MNYNKYLKYFLKKELESPDISPTILLKILESPDISTQRSRSLAISPQRSISPTIILQKLKETSLHKMRSISPRRLRPPSIYKLQKKVLYRSPATSPQRLYNNINS